jgi:hypothetical protein
MLGRIKVIKCGNLDISSGNYRVLLTAPNWARYPDRPILARHAGSRRPHQPSGTRPTRRSRPSWSTCRRAQVQPHSTLMRRVQTQVQKAQSCRHEPGPCAVSGAAAPRRRHHRPGRLQPARPDHRRRPQADNGRRRERLRRPHHQRHRHPAGGRLPRAQPPHPRRPHHPRHHPTPQAQHWACSARCWTIRPGPARCSVRPHRADQREAGCTRTRSSVLTSCCHQLYISSEERYWS